MKKKISPSQTDSSTYSVHFLDIFRCFGANFRSEAAKLCCSSRLLKRVTLRISCASMCTSNKVHTAPIDTGYAIPLRVMAQRHTAYVWCVYHLQQGCTPSGSKGDLVFYLKHLSTSPPVFPWCNAAMGGAHFIIAKHMVCHVTNHGPDSRKETMFSLLTSLGKG